MTDELLFSNILITAFIGLTLGIIVFFLLKGLTKKTNLGGTLSITLAIIVNVVHLVVTVLNILAPASYTQEYIHSAIITSLCYRLDLAFFWIIGTSLFWISTKKHEKTKKHSRSK